MSSSSRVDTRSKCADFHAAVSLPLIRKGEMGKKNFLRTGAKDRKIKW